MFNKRTSTGIFVPAKSGFVQYIGDTGNGSVNSVTLALGYELEQVYGPVIGSGKDKIHYVGFELFTRNIAFVLTSTDITYLTDKEVKKFLGNFSINKYFNTQKVAEALTDGIEYNSLNVDFLSKVLKLENVSRNGMFYAQSIDAYLYFRDGFLTDFHFDDGLFPGAKSLSQFNKPVFDRISALAYKYWPNDAFQAKKEINIQSEAWASIPNASKNEYVPLHETENGGANLHMIRVCHYAHPITQEQFKEINHGRYRVFVRTPHGPLEYICGMFSYTFDVDGNLAKVFLLSNDGQPIKIIVPEIADVAKD
ncbi:hypothetical protein DBR43_31720 [Pedobacter sp. KBW06]|uniref:hypothetical protein n=1 Tax=Pedobacter sp. KBW06 TaxID=2153359 RepID=UPI000F5B315F|nr:hypothetical protein [Pedobacter sp. KBW06]RQO64850.1 hypothetical protein DBR43_31720 [Pedobacter sp. KBW06]